MRVSRFLVSLGSTLRGLFDAPTPVDPPTGLGLSPSALAPRSVGHRVPWEAVASRADEFEDIGLGMQMYTGSGEPVERHEDPVRVADYEFDLYSVWERDGDLLVRVSDEEVIERQQRALYV